MLSANELGASGRKPPGAVLEPAGIALDRLPGLAGLFEELAELASSALEPLLGSACRVSIDAAESVGLFVALERLRGHQGMLVGCREGDARYLLVLESAGRNAIPQTIFAGEDPIGVDSEPTEFGPIAHRLAEAFVRVLAQRFCEVLAQQKAAEFDLDGLRPVADPQLVSRRDMLAVEVRLRLSLRAGESHVRFVLPQAFINSFRDVFAGGGSKLPTADPHWREKIADGVTKAKVSVFAILEEREMTLGDVALLRVGDVVGLRGLGSGRVRLDCAGRGVFWGRLGQGESGYRIVIEDPVCEGDAGLPGLPWRSAD